MYGPAAGGFMGIHPFGNGDARFNILLGVFHRCRGGAAVGEVGLALPGNGNP